MFFGKLLIYTYGGCDAAKSGLMPPHTGILDLAREELGRYGAATTSSATLCTKARGATFRWTDEYRRYRCIPKRMVRKV